jgi:hypothetical protein
VAQGAGRPVSVSEVDQSQINNRAVSNTPTRIYSLSVESPWFNISAYSDASILNPYTRCVSEGCVIKAAMDPLADRLRWDHSHHIYLKDLGGSNETKSISSLAGRHQRR